LQSAHGQKPYGTLNCLGLIWESCQKWVFQGRLNTITNKTFRLPSEAEWEYSCRANTKSSYHFGEILTPANANYVDSKHGTPIEVGSYKPNGFGLYDMHGNVWEWCNDFFSEYPEGKTIDPKGPEDGEFRTIRGGGFDAVTRLRAAFRNFSSPTDQTKSIGLRLALTNGT
jgi:formylglycine-generating enzyme